MTDGINPDAMQYRRMRATKCKVHEVLPALPPCARSAVSAVRLCAEHNAEVRRRVAPPGGYLKAPKVVERKVYTGQAAEILRDNVDLQNQVHDLTHLIRQLRGELDLHKSKAQRRPTPSSDGFVYFILSDNAVKIGWTSDLDQRLKQYSPGARLLAIKPGTRADEGKLHKKFAHLKTNRKEWFSYSPQVMEEVQRTIREHGEPPRDINEPLTATRIVGPRLDNYIGGKSKSA